MYKSRINGKITIQYKYWHSMMVRCYNKKTLGNQPTYEDKYVCEEWKDFQVFAKWFDENYYTINNERMELDKDILNKGNKVYSPETCVFVPSKINQLFNKNKKVRGDYPIGVRFRNDNGRFEARCSVYNYEIKQYKVNHLGYYNTPNEAFYDGYKPFKESYIKKVANYYKDNIPLLLYNAMTNYIVEIDD